MGGTDLADCGAMERSSLFRSRRAWPVEATEAVQRRIEAAKPDINSFIVLDREGALAEARAAERRYQRDEAYGPLDGVAATVKDLIDMAGFPPGQIARYFGGARGGDTRVVARLHRAAEASGSGAARPNPTRTSARPKPAHGKTPLPGQF